MNRWILRDLVADYRANIVETDLERSCRLLNWKMKKVSNIENKIKDLEILRKRLKRDVFILEERTKKEMVESHQVNFTHHFNRLFDALSYYFEVPDWESILSRGAKVQDSTKKTHLYTIKYPLIYLNEFDIGNFMNFSILQTAREKLNNVFPSLISYDKAGIDVTVLQLRPGKENLDRLRKILWDYGLKLSPPQVYSG